jgi:hypothetical protein
VAAFSTANQAKTLATPIAQELEGVVRNGIVELTNGKLPEGARVQVRVKK